MIRLTRLWIPVVAVALVAAACSSSDDSSAEPSTSAAAGDALAPVLTEPASPNREASPVPSAIKPEEITIRGDSAAPDFPAGLSWLNVARPLSLEADLSGKFVLLDFWTQGCINCIHIIPELKQLEEEFGDALVVVGVHWAKFDRERQTEAIRDSVVRYGVEHPVVNDEFEAIRSSYGVQAWPTIILVDPEGNIVGGKSGEGVYDVIAPLLEQGIPEWEAAGLLDETPLDTVLELEAAAPTVFSFPGKVLADGRFDRLFIADTGHHRVLVSNLAGELQFAIGSGREGFVDGPADTAEFSRPQGMALSDDGRILYVADRENHAIRAVDLDSEQVSTIAGTGENTFRVLPGPAATTTISSPWDLHLYRDQLFVAGAGRHQLWVVDLTTLQLDIFAGTGREGLADGPRLETTLSQPSGFADDGEFLYFTDPEASAIRRLRLDGSGEMETIIGDGLFSWGDRTGSFADTQLQHAVGIEYHNGALIVADTYNHQLKLLDLAAGQSATWVGANSADYVDAVGGEARLAEPSGLSIAGDYLYVADTNNHQIRKVDLRTAEAETIAFSNLDVAAVRVGNRLEDEVQLAPQSVLAGATTIEIDFGLPDGYKWNVEGTFTMTWTSSDPAVIGSAGSTTYEATGPELPVTFEVIASEGSAVINIESTVFYCLNENEAFCLIRDVAFVLPVDVGSGGSAIVATHDLPSAERLSSL